MREKESGGDSARWHPTWVSTLGAPVWVTDPSGRISYINARAGNLLGRSSDEVIGQQCHEVVAGRTSAGRPFCSAECPLRRLALRGQELVPFPLHLRDAAGTKRNVRVVVIAVQKQPHEQPHLVHCVVDGQIGDRVRRYLDGVASRTSKLPAFSSTRYSRLTAREKQILVQLARDRSVREIADELFLSYATVRNHTQHILRKLEAHSILEAVAIYILIDE